MNFYISPITKVKCQFCQYECCLENILEHFAFVHNWNENSSNNVTHSCLIDNCDILNLSYCNFINHLKNDHSFDIISSRCIINDRPLNCVNGIDDVGHALEDIIDIIDTELAKFLSCTGNINMKTAKSLQTMLHSIFLKTSNYQLLNAVKNSKIFEYLKDLDCLRIPFTSNAELYKRLRIRSELPAIYMINIKYDMELYLKQEILMSNKFNEWLSQVNQLEVILYCDDICAGNSLRASSKNVNITNFCYRIYCPVLANSSKLRHYRVLACTKARFAKTNSYKEVTKIVVNKIEETILNIQNRSITLNVKFITGDNVFMMTLFNVNLCYRAMGNNNCRICHIGGRLWSLYKTSNDLIHFYRGSIDIPFLKPYNNMVLDGFHDIVVGILKKALSNILPSFQKCSSMTNIQMRSSILQYAEANNCFHYLNTLLHETVFDKYVSGGTLNKLTGSQINAMSFSLYNLMKDYINDNNVEVNSLKKVKNMIGILKSLLNLVVILSNGELDYKTAARYWEQSANNFIAGFDVETGFKLKWSIKVHNILHYKEMILHFKIPPYWMSTMRFENANFKLKQVLASTSSRINSPKTIVKKVKWMSFLQSYINVQETYSDLRTWNYDIPLYEY